MTRLDIRFPTDKQECAAWLYLPDNPTAAGEPHPVIVMAHGLSGERTFRLDAFAERFTAAGYACLVFDYRHFGASDGQPRQVFDIPTQLADWTAAIAHARSLPQLDPERIALWGTSFSGGHVIELAAHDSRVVAVLAQCPFTDGLASARTIPWSTLPKLAALAVRDLIAVRRGHPRVLVASAGDPGQAALMATPDAVQASTAIMPLTADGRRPPPPMVTANAALDIPRHFPGRHAARVSCPILFTVCDRDNVAPAKATRRHARKAPRGEIRRYDAGHFDIYIGADFDTVVADQLNFLAAHVPVTHPESTS